METRRVVSLKTLLPQYDLVLESYCRLKFCEKENYEECQDIPAMRFYSFPKPTVNCTFQGERSFITSLWGEIIDFQFLMKYFEHNFLPSNQI